VVISGGGTAGHIYPALAVAHALREPDANQDSPAELLYLHGPSRRDHEVMAHAGIEHRQLDVGPIYGTAPHRLAFNLLRLGRATGQAASALRRFKADAVLATGGYVSAPAVLAARLSGVPVVLYLPDASPGLAVRALAPLATRIALSFPITRQYFKGSKAIVTGYPVRREFLEADKERARAAYSLRDDLPVVMVMGGSQGAQSLNLAVSDGLEPLLHHAQLIHLCGESDEQHLRAQRARLDDSIRSRYHLFRYLHRGVADAMAACDLMVCRAGASTLAELPILGLPAILVPGTFAGGHQEKNADFLVDEGGAIKVPDVQLSQGALLPAVLSLLEDRAKLAEMAAEMRRLARPEAAANIASLVRSVARRRRA
jgi:UDP-N-acetylglucosamine--N-acetylmuramyl-(pentapeptide) pyrophosphoryl-undecaprenol N-acetylglucosamine transferase